MGRPGWAGISARVAWINPPFSVVSPSPTSLHSSVFVERREAFSGQDLIHRGGVLGRGAVLGLT